MNTISIEIKNKLAKEVHENAVKHGFWEGNPSSQHFLCLVICELAEAVEADRKQQRADMVMFDNGMVVLKDDACNMYGNLFRLCIKDSVEDELADAYIRLLDLAGGEGVAFSEAEHNLVVSREHTFTETFTT